MPTPTLPTPVAVPEQHSGQSDRAITWATFNSREILEDLAPTEVLIVSPAGEEIQDTREQPLVSSPSDHVALWLRFDDRVAWLCDGQTGVLTMADCAALAMNADRVSGTPPRGTLLLQELEGVAEDTEQDLMGAVAFMDSSWCALVGGMWVSQIDPVDSMDWPAAWHWGDDPKRDRAVEEALDHVSRRCVAFRDRSQAPNALMVVGGRLWAIWKDQQTTVDAGQQVTQILDMMGAWQ